ncbi:hypothetical protein [Thauera sinica]|uniref:Uncharacterized protein n=1 Tax=Thauera sinica TaxID=2665146 RepID=A0ABW1AL17_9RHOO|nr:hypothetical protein [Thauera sp. K11]ATE62096.1 hypothetical protein CCZ27_20875 [Thauera sp. K11]
MDGFEGPFRFELDAEGTVLPWETLDPTIKAELLSDGNISQESSKVYLFKMAVMPNDYRIEKHHDWQKVSRLFVQATVGHDSMKLGGISPRNKKAANARQLDMGFDGRLEAEANLFSMAKVKLVLSNFIKKNATADRMAVLSSCTKKIAQWVYSSAWPFIDFKKYVYVAVPDLIPADQRYLKVSIKVVRKGNIEITQAGVHEHTVHLA